MSYKFNGSADHDWGILLDFQEPRTFLIAIQKLRYIFNTRFIQLIISFKTSVHEIE